MWIASKALKVSPFDPSLSQLTQAQLYWIILNHHKDQEEDLAKFRLLGYVVNPQNAKQVFDAVDMPSESVSVSDEDELLSDILSHTKEQLSPEQLKERLSMLSGGENDLDIIEKVE